MRTITSGRLARLNPLPDVHRGIEIGYFQDWPGGVEQFTAAVHWPEGWEELCLLCRSVDEIVPMAIECIDYGFLVRAMEKELGRPLTIDELPRVKCKE